MQTDILIVAPYPELRFVSEGWMSRIRAVDQIFTNSSRAYINFGPHHTKERDGHAIKKEERVVQYNLNKDEPIHQAIFTKLLEQAKFVYVHTVHLAINITDWLPSGKIIVDIHGIVPEEEIMLGRPDEAVRFEPIERMVLKHCRNLVVVTNSMKQHFLKKYPDTTANFIILPIYEKYNKTEVKRRIEIPEKLPRVVYAGGTQVWQNVEYMMKLAKETIEHVSFTFLSHDIDIFKSKAKDLGILKNVNIYKAEKKELPAIYSNHDFGFVLREETAVNTVSCPTKLSEYLDFGIVPIVKYEKLGDFEMFNYSYISDEDFKDLLIPDSTSRSWMIEQNKVAIDQLINQYRAGSSKLYELLA